MNFLSLMNRFSLMNCSSMNKRLFAIAALSACLGVCVYAPATLAQKVKITKEKPAKKKKAATDTTASAEPDKILFDRATAEIKRGHYTESRLDLQTLINTYPDSEYLAKAKLGVADSYYREGGTSNLTLAVGEYKNFIVFFPFLDEAAYAQMQVGMAHYRMMEKSDRDNSEALEAEQEFQDFLQKYPQSPLVPKAEQDLRNVQEVIADGQFRIASFYYVKQDFPAAAARLVDVSQRYPLYSESDEALWMLGNIYMRAKKFSKSEDDKNHWGDLAGKCFSQIVQYYPKSPRLALAKAQLTGMGMPVPASDPTALARMQKDQLYEKQHREHAWQMPMGMVRSRPDVLTADRYGDPNLNPPDDSVSAREVLVPGAPGPSFNISAKPISEGQPDASDSAPPVEAVPTTEPSTEGGEGNTAAAQIIAAPASAADAQPAATANSTTESSSSSSTPAAAAPAPAEATPNAAPAATSTLTVLPDSNSSSAAPAATVVATPVAAPQPAPAQAQIGQSQPAQANAAAPAAAPAKAAKADSKTESTSKKKKGVKKVIPW
jgi:outer membrane protein assembly factor BamD